MTEPQPQRNDIADDPWLSREEASAYSRYSLATIDRAVAESELRSVKHRNRRRFRRSWVDEWLLSHGETLLSWLLGAAFALAACAARPGDCPLL